MAVDSFVDAVRLNGCLLAVYVSLRQCRPSPEAGCFGLLVSRSNRLQTSEDVRVHDVTELVKNGWRAQASRPSAWQAQR